MATMDRRSMLGTAAVAAVTALSLRSGEAQAAGAAGQARAAVPPGDGAVHLDARVIAPPTTISKQAQDYLAKNANKPYEAMPSASDKEGWRRYVAAHNSGLLPPGVPATLPGVQCETRTMGGTTVYVAVRTSASADARKPHITIHGGGFTSLGGKMTMLLTQVTALQYGGTVYGIDYRMPPEHPYPVPLDDCLAVYREVLKLHKASDLLVSGGSAGGNLAAAMLLKARDAGLVMPRALFLDTPATDLSGAGDSIQTNRDVDVFLKRWIAENVALYANGADLAQPHLSPVHGDVSGFPPTYLRSGTRDLLLSDTVRFHAALRKAGVDADLYVREAMPHAGFGSMTPDDQEAREDTIRWLRKHWMAGAGG